MKKNYYVTKRLVSLALAVVLSSGSLFATAMAATVTVGTSDPSAATTNKDVFYFDAVTNASGGTAAVTGFSTTQDFISVKLPDNTYTLGKADDGAGNTQISMTKTDGTPIKLFTVVGVSAAKVLDVPSNQPVSYGVTGTGAAAVATVAGNAAFDITPDIKCPDGSAVDYAWTQNGAQLTSGVTFNASGKLSVPANKLAAGAYTFGLTATAGGTSGTSVTWTSQAITVSESCDAAVTFNFGSAPTAVSLVTGAQATVTVSATASVTATNCNIANHAATNHGKTLITVLTLPTPAPAGVTLSGGTLTIGSTTPDATNIEITATAGDAKATHTIKVTRTTIACDFTTSAVKFTPTAAAIDAETTTTYTLTPTLEGSGGTGCAEHSGAMFHGRSVVWTVTQKGVTPENSAIVGVTKMQSGNDMVLGLSAVQLVQPETTIVVTATVDGKSMSQEYKINRTKRCTMTAVLESGKVSVSSPSAGSTVAEVNDAVKFTVNTTAATLQMNPKLKVDGKCEYIDAKIPCPNISRHGVNWSIGGTNIAGITINSTTGVLSVDYSKLTALETTVTVFASPIPAVARTAAQSGKIVIRRGTLPSAGGGNNNSDYEEQSKNSQQWDKLEYKIEDADSKDNIKVSMGDNTNMPTRIVRELVGKNVTVEISVTGGYTWILNGKNLKKPPTYQIGIGMGVKTVKDKDATSLAKGNAIKVLELEHNGTFYGTYTLEQRVDTDYRNKYLYLYKYDDDANKLYYRGSAKVDDDGYVKFPFTSASTYVMTDKALYGEKAGSTVGGSTSGTGTAGSSSGSGGASVVAPPASSVAPPVASSSSSSESSTSSSEASEIELPSSSSEVSRPTDVEPDEPKEEPAKKSIPLIVPILLVVVTVTIIAVILLAKGGMNIGN